jgi:hypothetical protein
LGVSAGANPAAAFYIRVEEAKKGLGNLVAQCAGREGAVRDPLLSFLIRNLVDEVGIVSSVSVSVVYVLVAFLQGGALREVAVDVSELQELDVAEISHVPLEHHVIGPFDLDVKDNGVSLIAASYRKGHSRIIVSFDHCIVGEPLSRFA